MQVKTFEIRDRATFLPVLAVKLVGQNPQDDYLLRRAGYPPSDERSFVLLTGLNSPDKSTYDPYDWGSRTRAFAHEYIIKNWETLQSGAVIDVEFIVGETTTPKVSEAFV